MSRGKSNHLVEARLLRIKMMESMIIDRAVSSIDVYEDIEEWKERWWGIRISEFLATYCLQQGTRITRAREYLSLFLDSGRYYEKRKGHLFPLYDEERIIKEYQNKQEKKRKRQEKKANKLITQTQIDTQ